MTYNAGFFIQSIMLGLGLAMDAFSVSMANGLNFPCIDRKQSFKIAAIFSLFQAIMPLIGWFCVSVMVGLFSAIQPLIPWIALALLAYIGISMIREGLKGTECEEKEAQGLGFAVLAVQGIATSIDALSVGFTIADYNFIMALSAAAIIGAVTLIICYAGVEIGKKFGTKLAGKASILGGIILIGIGLEIFISSFL